jgi:hypothetical protein
MPAADETCNMAFEALVTDPHETDASEEMSDFENLPGAAPPEQSYFEE